MWFLFLGEYNITLEKSFLKANVEKILDRN